MNRARRSVDSLNRLAARWKYGQERKRGLIAKPAPASLPAENLESKPPAAETTN